MLYQFGKDKGDTVVEISTSKNTPIYKQLEQIRENICDNFCKYNTTCDENCECDWVRENNSCPLDRL